MCIAIMILANHSFAMWTPISVTVLLDGLENPFFYFQAHLALMKSNELAENLCMG